jgi:hypothetical protein
MRRALLVSMLCVSVALLFSGNAFALHNQGVAHCNACHTMHNSQNGAPVDPGHPEGNPWLLINATPSDVCLSCHSTGSRGVFAVSPLAPNNQHGGGDFCFLTEDNINDGYGGGTNPIPGSKSGHSIVAPSKGVIADPVLTHSPGGTFSSDMLGCSSCHAPHGNTNFRLLNGVGAVQDDVFVFTNPAPSAVGIALSSSAVESNTNHTAYHSGMSDWCANCHGDFHNLGQGVLKHVNGVPVGGTISNNYDHYNGTTHYLSGTHTTAYLKDVPFEDAATTVSGTTGPTAGSTVMCLSCHRPHATSSPDAGRWDFNVTFLSEDGVASGSYAIPDPYASPGVQRSLCNKCHVKDSASSGANPGF